jgi:hypothetical protein
MRHSLQSRMLGPRYLLLVDLPSSMHAAFAVVYKRVTGGWLASD